MPPRQKLTGPRDFDSLLEELAEREPRVLYVVPADEVTKFRERAGLADHRVEALGGHLDWRFFRLHRQSAPQPPRSAGITEPQGGGNRRLTRGGA